MMPHASQLQGSAPHASSRSRLTLFSLPPELRAQIFETLLSPDANRYHREDGHTAYSYKAFLPLLLTSRQIHSEALHAFHSLNSFIRIESPWPEAQYHIELEGRVPIIIQGDQAQRFRYHHLVLCIDAPSHPMPGVARQRFVILVDDVEKFARMWFYAELSHPGLNAHLRLTLRLRDPFTPSGEKKVVPIALQRRLLLEFGRVKNLSQTIIDGDPYPHESIVKEVRAAQAIPYVSPEACLRAATQHKAEGNVYLTAAKPDPNKALECYDKAWRAIHIVIHGRQRHIHADAFFSRELVEEPYRYKNGQMERLTLRVQLVANTCLAYLKLQNWEDCRFWGLRTINMLREAMGADARHESEPTDEAFTNFPAANEMGKIYYRVGVASKELGNRIEARKLLRVAEVYLPHDQSIKNEIRGLVLQI